MAASCAKSTRDVSGLTKPHLAPVPSVFLEPCDLPQVVPEGATVGELIAALDADKGKLNECANRHAGLVSAIEVRDSIQGQGHEPE